MAATKQQGVSEAVLRYFQSHRNTELHVDDVAADTTLTASQVMGAVSVLRNKWGETVDSPRKGWYVYRGSGRRNGTATVVPHKAKAQVIALLDDDRLLVTVEGVVYVATPLEVE